MLSLGPRIDALLLCCYSFSLEDGSRWSPVEEDTHELLAAHAPLPLDVELLDHAVDLVVRHVLVQLLDDGAQVVHRDHALGALVEQHERLKQLLARVPRGDVPGGDALEPSRAIDAPAVGRMNGGMLKLGKRDIADIEGGGPRKGGTFTKKRRR
ncbi:hypothetical protein CHU98_g2924 [Xylaria longipes]|nr:hypothetical protein CHU98_g2924 [Xylaria longipes]